ncbi:DNA primase [Candidatus Roizmanbacteria bacterium RIFCSPLOWO2_01_FULL_37_12]|uniref:DNA primase n=1 Tax=Candidatus Roizmanbacteria bacterium RIFCSPLOWO2_01_FULL_37_12 TaxID=1802056 RepID=A0A1F7IE49_9BACT|nr:MAG: DNA primase [Candidatus Roizmanbacteria bacterium RIFCSPHIGHO2_02_FULL_37_9b]OGK41630.1 MAG: DNA primase [Candidatus Roizmanbacteria bacterium RIFCSPLOWO2_01_FULL_37_12]
MESVVEEIKKKLDIVVFISSFIPLKKTGRNYKSVCPFHQERTPSFVVSQDRQIWHCFGACQEGGDLIKFLMKWENITFIEALRELAEKAGIKLTKVSFDDHVWKKKERIVGINTLAAEFFEYILHKTQFGKKANEYLRSRDLDERIIKKFQLGYAPHSWDSLLKFLKKKKYGESEILDSGLMVRSERGGLYDRFRGRLIFPLKDARGNVIGFSGRVLDEDAKEAKYINTPETFLYHKRETLFGINLAKEAAKKENNIILVEGEFDVISPYQHGIQNIAAIKGSALTREQLMFLKRFTDKITLALDSDLAGEEAMKKGIEEAEILEFNVSIASFDFAKDPDEAVRKDPVKFKKALKNSLPYYDFIINISQKKNSADDPYGKKKIAEEVGVFIEKIKNPIVLSHYIKKIASILKVSEGSVEVLIRNLKRKKQQKFALPTQKKTAIEIMREVVIQKYLLSIIFQSENPYNRAEEIFKTFTIEDFSVPAFQKICQLFFKYKEKHKQFDLNNFIETLAPELRSTFDEVFLFASTEIEVKNEKIEKLVYEAKRYSLKRKITELSAFDSSDENEIKENLRLINQELTRVEKKIITL